MKKLFLILQLLSFSSALLGMKKVLHHKGALSESFQCVENNIPLAGVKKIKLSYFNTAIICMQKDLSCNETMTEIGIQNLDIFERSFDEQKELLRRIYEVLPTIDRVIAADFFDYSGENRTLFDPLKVVNRIFTDIYNKKYHNIRFRKYSSLVSVFESAKKRYAELPS